MIDRQVKFEWCPWCP